MSSKFDKIMFSNYYQKNILPLYGEKRDNVLDHKLLEVNTCPNLYSVQERVDFTHLPTYSIDPQGCEDADDAFSIFFKQIDSSNAESLKPHLAIHIADPTEFIELNSSLWLNIVDRAVTRYPSQIRPIHLMPQSIVDQASLMENKYGTEKYAISVVTEISNDTFLPINNVEILFTKITVSKRNNYSYEQAANLVKNSSMVLNTGIKIAKALFNKRNTVGKKLNQEILSRVKYDSETSKPYFVKDSSEIIQMKHMIEEFAIFANSVVGKYLTYKMNGLGIFRTCESKEWLDSLDSNISGAELMEKIIDNGISANYLSEVLSHDLVGVPEYCHFTSPIRRVTDCVCHYLLKYIHLKEYKKKIIPPPFVQKKLEIIANHSQTISKKMKKVQFRDFKYQNLETLLRLCNKKAVNISIRFTGYTGLFVNFLITKIDGHKVSVSYVLRVRNYQYVDYWNKHPQRSFDITHVNIPGKFDEGTLPEIDAIIKTPITIESLQYIYK